MQIGRKLYYELLTGVVIVDTGEREGSVIETTWDQDFESYVYLSERVPSTVDVIQLEFGQFAQDFTTCKNYKVDVSTSDHTITFTYPDPNDPEAPPVFEKPLSVKVTDLEEENSDLRAELNQVKADSADLTLAFIDLIEMITPA